MDAIKLTCVVGARPNFMKMAALAHAMQQRPRFLSQLIHTGQHFSPEMSHTFFDELRLPVPDCNLGVGGGTQAEQTAGIMKAMEPVLASARPDIVVVVGDVNSTMATALVSAKLGIPIAHIEAGLRSFDRTMPEEINRLVTDVLSTYLFASEESGVRNLRAEGIPEERIFFAGNVMIDTLLRFQGLAAASPVLKQLGLQQRGYALVTLHRPSNVDHAGQLRPLVEALRKLAERIPVVFSVHPRTQQRLAEFGIPSEPLLVIPPQGYVDFLRLTSEARLVLTDSGGIQEETTFLQVPCLTLRDTTERPATVEMGTNRLTGTDPDVILEAAHHVLDSSATQGRVPTLWDGRAAERILDVIERQRL